MGLYTSNVVESFTLTIFHVPGIIFTRFTVQAPLLYSVYGVSSRIGIELCHLRIAEHAMNHNLLRQVLRPRALFSLQASPIRLFNLTNQACAAQLRLHDLGNAPMCRPMHESPTTSSAKHKLTQVDDSMPRGSEKRSECISNVLGVYYR